MRRGKGFSVTGIVLLSPAGRQKRNGLTPFRFWYPIRSRERDGRGLENRPKGEK